MEKNKFETWFLFVVFGIVLDDPIFGSLGLPSPIAGAKTQGTLWGSIPITLEPVPLT